MVIFSDMTSGKFLQPGCRWSCLSYIAWCTGLALTHSVRVEISNVSRVLRFVNDIHTRRIHSSKLRVATGKIPDWGRNCLSTWQVKQCDMKALDEYRLRLHSVIPLLIWKQKHVAPIFVIFETSAQLLIKYIFSHLVSSLINRFTYDVDTGNVFMSVWWWPLLTREYWEDGQLWHALRRWRESYCGFVSPLGREGRKNFRVSCYGAFQMSELEHYKGLGCIKRLPVRTAGLYALADEMAWTLNRMRYESICLWFCLKSERMHLFFCSEKSVPFACSGDKWRDWCQWRLQGQDASQILPAEIAVFFSWFTESSSSFSGEVSSSYLQPSCYGINILAGTTHFLL